MLPPVGQLTKQGYDLSFGALKSRADSQLLVLTVLSHRFYGTWTLPVHCAAPSSTSYALPLPLTRSLISFAAAPGESFHFRDSSTSSNN